MYALIQYNTANTEEMLQINMPVAIENAGRDFFKIANLMARINKNEYPTVSEMYSIRK